MTRVLTELPFRYAVLTGGRWHGPASAVHEPSPAGSPGRASPTAPAASSAHAVPPRRSPESSTARVRLRLKPGQKGTKRLLTQYGDRLICVRYRYEPSTPPVATDQIVELRVAFAEVAVRERVKQAGGTWNPERRVWQLRYDSVVALGLNRRIANEPASTSGCQR